MYFLKYKIVLTPFYISGPELMCLVISLFTKPWLQGDTHFSDELKSCFMLE
jgi:hypothetical protein